MYSNLSLNFKKRNMFPKVFVSDLAGERKNLPFFYQSLRRNDSAILLRQMRGKKFAPAIIAGVGERCCFGCPRVIVCSPLRGFSPFPTSFWLTCPWLLRIIGTAESGGGVAELESWIEERGYDAWIAFNVLHQRLRLAMLSPVRQKFLRSYKARLFDSLRRGGVGGIRCQGSVLEREVHVKCLHLQVASWLTLRYHPGELWLAENGLGQDCDGKMCDLCVGEEDERCGKDVLRKKRNRSF